MTGYCHTQAGKICEDTQYSNKPDCIINTDSHHLSLIHPYNTQICHKFFNKFSRSIHFFNDQNVASLIMIWIQVKLSRLLVEIIPI